MAYTISSTMNLVLAEAPGAIQPQLLPWIKAVTDNGTTARMGGGVVPPGSNNLKIDLPGITTASTIWFFPDADMDVSLGQGNAGIITVLAGGCIGFSAGSGPADGALRVTYSGTDPATYTFLWGGT